MSKVHTGGRSNVRITTYTIEGVPIINTLNYNGEIIKCDFDTRRDDFSNKNDRTIINYSFIKINKEMKNNMTVYFLTYNNNFNRMDILNIDNN